MACDKLARVRKQGCRSLTRVSTSAIHESQKRRTTITTSLLTLDSRIGIHLYP